mmetsp:Transcript_34255/g.101811  ORF Transcript_34255/g.101811 Transcript_34255/m.101811 type:complete len:424 (-) Transcript_34255:408-1679(-)
MADDEDIPEAVVIGQPVAPEHFEDRRIEAKHIPVTVITGFLGAGKSTLVRHILSADHGYRVAVIMNEYGESVEGSYWETPEGQKANMGEWIELSNGCMCCAVKTEFVQAIEGLLLKKEKFDYILIETTGLANPGPVAAALWTDEELEAGVQLDGMVVVVDAINIDRQLNDPRPEGVANEAQVQVAYADVVLLNKMDLVGEEAVDRAVADIRAINSSVQIIKTKHSAVDLGLILNRQGYSRSAEACLDCIEEADEADDGEGEAGRREARKHQPAASSTPGQPRRSSSRARRSSNHHSRAMSLDPEIQHHSGSNFVDHDHALHDARIQTCTLVQSKPLDLEKTKKFMDRLLWDREIHPEDIYRVKGLLQIAGSDSKHVVHAVYELYNISDGGVWQEGQVPGTKIVVIGRNLKVDQLQEWLDGCVA